MRIRIDKMFHKKHGWVLVVSHSVDNLKDSCESKAYIFRYIHSRQKKIESMGKNAKQVRVQG